MFSFPIFRNDEKENLHKTSCILHPTQYMLIWRISFLCLFSAFYAAHRGHYDLAAAVFGVFLTSINYWRRPDYSWRRYLDMVYVKSAMVYQMARAYRASNATVFYVVFFTSVCFYPVGIVLYKRGHFWYSTYAHCGLHILANISNFILYSGEIPFQSISPS